MHQNSSSLLNLSHVIRFRLGCWEWDWQWRFQHIVAIIFRSGCLSFQFSVYFVVSEMRVIWVISCISNSNINQKRFYACKSSSNLLSSKSLILCISKCSFFEKACFETLPNAWFIFLISKSAFCRLKVQTNGRFKFLNLTKN